MKKSMKVIVSYRDRKTKCPMGSQVFVGRDTVVLAANYQSRHPELEETSFEVIWPNRLK